MRHADSDFSALLDETLPPADLSKLAIFRATLRRYDKEARSTQLCSFFTENMFELAFLKVEEEKTKADEQSSGCNKDEIASVYFWIVDFGFWH